MYIYIYSLFATQVQECISEWLACQRNWMYICIYSYIYLYVYT